jgi:hypothetical protein
MVEKSPARPSPSFFRYFVENSNPFYLISACCMLAGCLALTNSLSWLSIPLWRLLILLATLNVYEAALIGLAAYLVLVRGFRRDGMMLVILEAFFFIDITFLNAEISTQKSWIGPTIALASFLAAAVKLAVILRVLGVRKSAAEFAFILLQIAAILALPIAFGRTSTGVVSPLMFYVAWWIVGLMPAAYEFLAKCLHGEEERPKMSPVLVTFMVLPVLSLAAHLGILHYVYDVPFYGAMAAGPLLGLGIAFMRVTPGELVPRKDVMTLRVLLPIAAVAVSASSPGQLTLFLDPHGHWTMTTLRLATIAAFLEFVYAFVSERWVFALSAGLFALLADAYGPTAQQVSNSSADAMEKAKPLAWDVIPTTSFGWGAWLVALAFVFLALGAAVSLRRPSVSPPDEISVDLNK